jgi:hypothetical protein
MALHEGKCDLAHEIHLQLMLDYVSEVGQWMVAVKRLIQECRTIGPLSPTCGEPQEKIPELQSTETVLKLSPRNPPTLDDLSSQLDDSNIEEKEGDSENKTVQTSNEENNDLTTTAAGSHSESQ